MKASRSWFVRGDLDGFFGLMVDNLVQVLLIVTLCRELLHFPDDLVFERILPGVAVSLLIGNLYYAWQARRLARATGRDDVTALPYGINTPSIFAYVFLVMAPAWGAAGGGAAPEVAARAAWQAGLVACLLSGVIETVGAAIGPWLRRHTPRAALLAALSGIAVGFISMDFALRIFRAPLVGLIGLGFVLAHYMSRRSLPLGLPAGLLAVVVGTVVAALVDHPLPVFDVAAGPTFPVPVVGSLFAGFEVIGASGAWTVILSMGLLNVLGTLQNVESAEAAGDAYPVGSTMVVNGLGSMAAALFGSCFPTTVYIGHPGWKALGARWGYSAANGFFWVLVITLGLAAPLAALVPVEAGAAIVVWIAIVIVAQAFQATPRRHAPAVAFGLFPAICAWGVVVITGALGAGLRHAAVLWGVDPARARIDEAMVAAVDGSGALAMVGALHLWAGFLFTATIWGAMGAHLIDRQFGRAALWAGAAAVLASVGMIHGFDFGPGGPVERIAWGAAGWRIPPCYAALALIFVVQHLRTRGVPAPALEGAD